MTQKSNDSKETDAAKMQRDNASGANGNEQGQASFTTGSTTGAGSNFGQGSSQLGAESYRQGSSTNSGANYNNEAGALGSSSTGTSNEGSSSQNAGAAHVGSEGVQSYSAGAADIGGSSYSDNEGNREGRTSEADKVPKQDERSNTDLEHSTHLDTDNTTADRRANTGSWSDSSLDTGGEQGSL